MRDQNIRNDLKEIVKKLDRISKVNDNIQTLLIIIIIILIVLASWIFQYFFIR